MSGGMSFSMSRPVNERFHVKSIPRAIRKPAPSGTTRALDETLVGTLDSVADTKNRLQGATQHRRPLARHLVESQPEEPRPARQRVHRDGTTTPPPISSLSTDTLRGGPAQSEGTTNNTTLVRSGKRIVDQTTRPSTIKNFSLFKPASPAAVHPGKKIFSDRLQEETVQQFDETLHKKRVMEPHATDTPSILRFSPRKVSARPTTAPPAVGASLSRGKGRPSEGVRGALAWTGATPRYGSLKVSHNLRPSRPAPTSSAASSSRYQEPSQPRVNPPFDASFRQPAGVASNAQGRRRGPQLVSSRPKTARGLLRWD